MTSSLAGIDHIIVGVRDLEAARRSWMRLGFTVTPRGRHIGQGTANYCIMFACDYLELLGFVERDEHAHRLETFLAQREGPMSVAFAPERDTAATAASLAARGLHPSAPRALGRALELPEGAVTPRFSLLNLPPEETPALDYFVCGHLTPELVRRPELSVVLFRRQGWDRDRYESWSARLLEDQIGFVVPTTWEGESVARLALLHPDTTVAMVAEILDTML